MKLWHCADARSLRPLWALEEMQLDYELDVLPFPPRVFQKEYLKTNALGTVPYFVDGDVTMTESSAICQYLVDKYQRYDFGLKPEHPEYGNYLNWLYHSDATLTFPLTVTLRYLVQEPGKCDVAGTDYAAWHLARLRMLNGRLEDHEYLCADKFTIADVTIAYALLLGEKFGLTDHYKPQTQDYLQRMKQRPALIRARELTPTGTELPKVKLPKRSPR